jgi:glycine oxidase
VDYSEGEVVVIGAGLIGLAIAFELAERGVAVRVLDRAEPARAASWAAAGMLAPYTEAVRDTALFELCASSLSEYPRFVERVIRAGGIDPRLHLDGVLHAAFDEARMEELRRHAHALAAKHIRCGLLDREAVLVAEPWIGSSVVGGVIIEGEGYVDNRLLGRALLAACEARGVRIESKTTVHVQCDRRRVLGVRTGRGFVPSAAVINAGGSRAASVEGIPRSCRAPIEPIKGQMFALAAPMGMVRRPTWVPGAYLVPRDDGRLLVGATVERAGFDERITAQGMHRLLDAALAAAPSLAELSITESWAGLRPGTPDGLPFLGPTAIEGLFVAAGHYRNGVLLAPASARLIANAIEGRDVTQLLPFALGRLGTELEPPDRITHA